MLKALQTIRNFRNLVQSNEVIDAREIETELAQLLSGKACWECGDRRGSSCQCSNDE
jgi:hypothetical protein